MGDDNNAERIGGLLSDMLIAVRNGHTPTLDDVNHALDEARDSTLDKNMTQLLGDKPAAIRQDLQIRPRTHGQKEYLDMIKAFEMILVIGPAGTGKTYLAMAAAVSALLNKRVERIILTRPAVEAGESLGFLPGDLEDKINPYLRPLYDALYSMVGVDKVQRFVDHQRIEIAPLAFMRGRTLDNAFVILDEAQNTTTEQMMMFLTRLGQDSHAIINGDITQIDLPKGTTSGLREAQRILQHVDGVGIVQLSKQDVVRNPLVQRIIDAYDADKEGNAGDER